MKDSFADILKQTRKEKHLSQQQLAEMLFVERCSVANWESGRRTPDTVLLIRIAKCLEIDINLLLEAIDSTVEEPNIIMVNDEKIVLKGGMNVICKLLPNASVTGFTSPKEALTFAKSIRIHLAFLDIEMGNFSGLDLCHELLKLNPRINIIYYSIGVIELYDEESAKAMAKRMKDILPDMLKSAGMDMAFAQISVYHDDMDVNYIVPSDEAASRVLENAFGKKAAFDGLSYVFRPGMSRKKVLVPAVTEVLESKENSASEIKADAAVSYLGPEGTYTEEAAKFFFKAANSLIPKKTVDEAIEEVKNGSADYAVIPQENTIGGAVTNYVDALIREKNIYVVGEVIIPINQTLMGIEGAALADIKTVCSHSQGLTQSKTWRTENLPDAEEREMDSTAAAASFVAESKDKSIAAVAAPGAAELYGLTVLAENVQISDTNKTRFYVLSNTKNEFGKRAVFIANCGADQIDDIIVELNNTGFEMVALHDRPDGTKLGSYNYVIETEADNISSDMIDKITAYSGVRFAGCFDLSEKTNN